MNAVKEKDVQIKVTKRFLAAALAATILLGLFAGCYRDRPTDAFTGANDFPYSVGGQFTINVTGNEEDAKRFKYVVCDVTLEIDKDKKASVKMFEERNHRIRDIIICTISSKLIHELRSYEQREELKQEIMDRINEEFNDHAVKRVSFGEFFFH
jgi:flagellar basal body-associated protein FliL